MVRVIPLEQGDIGIKEVLQKNFDDPDVLNRLVKEAFIRFVDFPVKQGKSYPPHFLYMNELPALPSRHGNVCGGYT